MGVGPAVAREDDLDALISQQLGGLDARSPPQPGAAILEGLDGHAVRFDQKEVGTPTKPGIHDPVEGGGS